MKLIDALKEIGSDSNKYAIDHVHTYGIRYKPNRHNMVSCNKDTGEYLDGICFLSWDYPSLSSNDWEIKTVINPKYKIGDRFLLNDLCIQEMKTDGLNTTSIMKNIIGEIITWASDANGNVIYTVSTGGITFPLILTEEYLEKLPMVVSQEQIMRVEFLENVDISGKYNCLKGEQYEALEYGDFIMIRMKDKYVVKAPKDAVDKIFKILS